MVNWAKIRLLEARLRWWRMKHGWRKREWLKWKATGDRSHHWYEEHKRKHENAAAKADEAQWPGIRKHIQEWGDLLNEADRQIHKYEVAIRALKPKAQFWPLGGLVAPGESWNDERWDEGKDFEIPMGNAVRAPGAGQVIEWAHDRAWPAGFGDPYLVIRIDTGPFHDIPVSHGRDPLWYVGHCNNVLLSPGDHFSAGEPIARTDHGFYENWGWCEFGHWAPGPMDEGEHWRACYAGVWR